MFASSIASVHQADLKTLSSVVESVPSDLSDNNDNYEGSSPLIESTFGDAFARVAAKYPDNTAIIDNNCQRRVTYKDFEFRSISMAAALQKRGIKKGDRVATNFGTTIEACVATMACYKLGAIAVPLNPAYKLPQAIGALNHVTAKCLILSAQAHLPFRKPTSNIPLIRSIIDDKMTPSVELVIIFDDSHGSLLIPESPYLHKWDSMLEQEHVFTENDVEPDDVALIQFTSGTTSAPKAACLTHFGILNCATIMGERMKYTDKDIICCPLPLFHVAGTVLGVAISHCYGAAVAFPAKAFDPIATVNTLRALPATSVYGVPTMFVSMIDHIIKDKIPSTDFGHLRTGIICGSPVHVSLLKRSQSVMNLPDLVIGWGMSETTGCALMTQPDEGTSEQQQNTVGTALRHMCARVVSRNDPFRELPFGERGEIVVKGYQLMKGYWNDPKKTNEAKVCDPRTGEIWLRTGDEGSQDTDGYVTVTGRIKDIIIRGGENIHPAEIESILVEHESILDASVVGIPDAKYGEVVGAFVVLENGRKLMTAAEVQGLVATRLGGSWVPREVFFVSDMPKTGSGKIQKFELREEARRLLANNV